jgi:hypothetical protein
MQFQRYDKLLAAVEETMERRPVKHCNLLGERKGTTRGLVILVARLTAREHKRIFLLCHNFAIPKQLWENESQHVGRNEMSASLPRSN